MMLRALALSVAMLLSAWAAQSAVYYAGAFRSQPITFACNNGVDDDGDGATDYSSDAGCSSAVDTSELNLSIECDDGQDNDGDTLVDYKTSGGDPGCSSRTDTQEGPSAVISCNDGVDNDGDGATDYPTDTGCTALTDTNELNLGVQCDDGLDNDSDTFIDYKTAGGDPQCSSSTDNTEAAPVLPACNNTLDDDGDGATDYPADPGCGSINDTYEFGSNECDNNLDDDGDTDTDYPDDADCDDPSDLTEATDIPTPLCNNGADDDGDGLVDWPADPGCESNLDVDESLASLACDDGADNDGDSLADFRTSGGDPGCSSATDSSETYGTECDDGEDNDLDGDTDYPADANCTNALDNTEDEPPPPGDVTAAFTAEYTHGPTSCVGPPCVIYLDATATTDPTVEDTLRDLVYDWDCGDDAMGIWVQTGNPRRYPKGYHTGCYYPDGVTTGSKTITLTVTNPVTGATDTATTNITITSIVSGFADSDIHCFSNDTDHTGCPTATSAQRHSSVSSFTSALSTCGAGTGRRACLFKRGDTFSSNPGALSTGTSPGIIGAYGTGARPTINSLTSGFTPRSGWSISNLNMVMTAGSPFGSAGPNMDRYSVMDVTASGFTGGCYSTSTGDASATRLNTLEAFAEVDCLRSGTASDVGTMFLHRGNKFMGLGGEWNNGGGANSEFVYRTVGASDSVWQNLFLTGAGTGTNRNAMQFRAWAQAPGGATDPNPTGIGPPPEPMRRNVISDNIIEYNTYNAIKFCQNNVCSPAPEANAHTVGSGAPQAVSDFLFERNHFRGSLLVASVSFGSGFIVGQGGRITIRNNTMDLQSITGASPVIASRAYNYTNCFLCDTDNWTVQGNTVYYDEDLNTTITMCKSGGTSTTAGTGHTCDHNLIYRPADSGSTTTWTSGLGWTSPAVGNYNATSSPFAGTIPTAGESLSSDFILNAATAAINGGTPTERLDRDACHATRPSGASHDAGAWEYGALCPSRNTTIGINSEKMLADEEFIMFADAIDNSAQIRVVADPSTTTYESFTRSYTSVGGTLSGTAIPANNEGWPSVDLPTAGTNLVARIDVMQAGTGAQPYPTGTYTLRFDGKGTVQVTGDGTVTCTGTNASCSVTITPSSTGTSLWITSSDPDNTGANITNVDLLLPGYTSASQFYEPSLRRLSPFAYLRTLNAIRVNDYECSNLAPGNQDDVTCTHTWGTRTTETGIQSSRRGVSWERLIDFANAAGVGLWVTIPHAADDTYITNLATMLRDDLDGTVYMELSNEVWNSGFTQEQYFTNVGAAAGWGAGETAERRAYVERAADAADIFDSIFTGGDAARLVKVIGSQLTTTASESSALITALASATYNPTSASFDGMALNPYFAGSGASATAILDDAEDYINSTLPGYLATEFAAIDAAGMEMFAYEGGALIEGSDAASVAANDDDRMEGLIEDLFDVWYAAGGTTSSMGFICRDSRNSGALRYPTQSLVDAPKYRGYLRVIEGQ